MQAARPIAPGSTLRLAVVGKGGVGKTTVSATIARTLARRGAACWSSTTTRCPGSRRASACGRPTSRCSTPRWSRARTAAIASSRGSTRSPRHSARDRRARRDPRAAGRQKHNRRPRRRPSIRQRVLHDRSPCRACVRVQWLGDRRRSACGRSPDRLRMDAVRDAFPARRRGDMAIAAYRPADQAAANEIRPDARVSLVVSKATEPADAGRISAYLDMPVYGVIALDEDVRLAERIGVPVFEHAPDSVAVAAITRIAERLDDEERLALRSDLPREQRDPPGAPA